MDTPAKTLTAELSRLAEEIVHTSHQLQKEFAQLSAVEVAGEDGKPCQDPVKLIRRICALERAILDLTVDCEKIAKRRSEIAPAVIEAQQENIALIRELSEHFPGSLLDDTEPDAREHQDDEHEHEKSGSSDWAKLAIMLEEQAKFFPLADREIEG